MVTPPLVATTHTPHMHPILLPHHAVINFVLYYCSLGGQNCLQHGTHVSMVELLYAMECMLRLSAWANST